MKTMFEFAAEERREEARVKLKAAVALAVLAIVALVMRWPIVAGGLFFVCVMLGVRVLGCHRDIKRYAQMSTSPVQAPDAPVFIVVTHLGETHGVAIVGNEGDAEEEEMARRVAGRIEANPDGYKASLQHMLDDGARRFPDWADYIRIARIEVLEILTTGERGELEVRFAGEARWFFGASYDVDGFKDFYVKT